MKLKDLMFLANLLPPIFSINGCTNLEQQVFVPNRIEIKLPQNSFRASIEYTDPYNNIIVAHYYLFQNPMDSSEAVGYLDNYLANGKFIPYPFIKKD